MFYVWIWLIFHSDPLPKMEKLQIPRKSFVKILKNCPQTLGIENKLNGLKKIQCD